ncbi:bacterio-opsin activator domain-containing protein [Halosimplex amylolyticum]|uniref:bacterio-opsin activator domain-containing protein n=1 Tax=Halosimplex amylolyticum TaxID=3396616 RepID=UPI003F569AC6
MGSDSGSTGDIYAETLAVFDRRPDQYEPLTTPEVAAALDAERRTVYQRLTRLVERDALETKQTGANARVWWRPIDSPSPVETASATDTNVSESTYSDGSRVPEQPSTDLQGAAWSSDAERWARAMRSMIDGVAVVDDSGKYRYANSTHAAVYGYEDPTAFLGEHWAMCYDDDELERFTQEIIPAVHQCGGWRGEATGKRKDGTTFPEELSLTVTDDGGMVCVVRDITDRKERERQLREAREFNEELVEQAPFGMFRLDEDLRITYENPRAEEIIGLPDDVESSDAIGVPINELPPIVETGQADLFETLLDGETIEFDFPFESIYGKEAYFTGRAVPVYRDDEFNGAILMATDISERRQYERTLERQREQLAALDELNDVVRGITDAVIDQPTRSAIEQVVCDRLAKSDSYRLAWIGAADAEHHLDVRVATGTDGCLGEVAITSGSDMPTERSPIERAIATRSIQVLQHTQGNPSSDRFGEHAREFGYRSAAVIPIGHQGVMYGILGVYSERPDAFAEAEREVIGQLGDVVGHAIAAVDRKRALLSDEVVELELQIPTLGDATSVPTTDGSISIDRITPLRGDEYLLYGRAALDAVTVLETFREQRPEWGTVETFDERDGEVRFEQHLSNEPIVSTIAAYGGNFTQGSIEQGAISVTVELLPGTDARRIIETIQDTHPGAQIVRQRQATRETATSADLVRQLVESLTNRQRAAVEAAYFGGYFDSPRLRSGEEIAASLDIQASTFHQHLRKAQRKLFEIAFTEL